MADTDALSFAKDIRPLFTDTDVDHMRNYALDLSDRDQVEKYKDDILATVSDGSMPPAGTGERWTKDMCDTFKRWMDQGCPP